MSRKYKFHNPEGVYFVSFVVQGWVDARHPFREEILTAGRFLQGMNTKTF